MLLQLAIDRLEGLFAQQQADDVIDIIEVGTPMIQRFGLSLVMEMKSRTLHPILADLKIVDGGREEAEAAFRAGAKFVTVLAMASTTTKQLVFEVARQWDGYVVLDTLGMRTADIFDRRWPDELAYVLLHANSDAAKSGQDSLLDRVRQDLAAEFPHRRLALAGGIVPDKVDALIALGPQVLVVGSAIYMAQNPREVASAIRQRMTNAGTGWPWQ